MLLVMHNLPAHIKYSDIKILIRNKCYIDDVILDKLLKDGASIAKKVTIGVAKEDDAMRILHRLNGTYVEGQQIFIEEVKKGSSEMSTNRNSSGMDYPNNRNRTENQSLNQVASGHQMDSVNPWNMQMFQQYGFSMPAQPSGYQAQDVNQQEMNMQMMKTMHASMGMLGSGVAKTSVPPLMQSNYMAYGNQQGQQQLTPSLGQFGGSGSDTQLMGTPKELGYIARGLNRGYDSDDIQIGFGSQQYADKGFGTQGYQGSSRQDTRDYDSRDTQRESRFGNQMGSTRNETRGLGSEDPWENNRGFSQGNDRFRDSNDRKRRHSPERSGRNERGGLGQSQGYAGNQGRGFEERDSRGKGLGSNQGRAFESDSRNKGFGNNQSRGFESGSRGGGLGSNQGRGFGSDSRGGGLGSDQDEDFESDSRGGGLGSNQYRGFGSDSRGGGLGSNQGRDFESDSRGGGLGSNQYRGFGSDSRGGGLGSHQGRDFESDSRGGGLGSNQNRGFGSDSRGGGLGSNQGRGFESDSRGKGFGKNQRRSFESDSRGKGLGGNLGGSESDSRSKGGNNQGRSGPGLGGNQGRGFESKALGGNKGKGLGGQDSFNRGVTSRDIFPPKPTPKPHQPPVKASEPYSWSNTGKNPPKTSPAKPFGNKPSFSNVKPFNKKPNPGPPLSQSSPVKPVVPEKRAKIEDTSKSNEKFENDPKTAHRAVSWRGMGISFIVKSILDRFVHADGNMYKHGKKAYHESVRLLKRDLNSRLDAIIKQKYPRNPCPLLQKHQIVELYRSRHPESDDVNLVKTSFASPAPSGLTGQHPNPNPLPKNEPPQKMGPPKTPNVPQAKSYAPPPSKKPTLSDLLPTVFRQMPNIPRQLRQKPVKKPKPVDLVKRAKQERKLLHKTEFLDESLYKCKTPAMEEALNAVLDEITNVYINAVEEVETTDKEEKMIAQGIIDKTSAEFRSTMRLHTIKRILNENSALMLRVFINGGRAPKTEVERVLQPYGITYLKASKNSKTPMLVACVETFETFDTLCSHTGVACNGRDGTSYVTAKPLHLTIPMKFRRLLRQRKLNEDDDDGNFEGDDNDDDGDDDDDDMPGDEDDDVIEVVKEPDVIELSGDENVKENEKDCVKPANTRGKVHAINKSVVSEQTNNATNKSEGKPTIDLTDEDFTADVSVGDKVCSAVYEEMDDALVEIDEEVIGEDDLEDY